jgi:predicted permease
VIRAGAAPELAPTIGATVNQQFAVSSGVIVLGWVLRRFLLDDHGARTVVLLVFNFTLPALVIHTFDGARLDPALVVMPVASVAHGLAIVALGGLAVFAGAPRRDRGLLTMLLPGGNVGMFAYPLVEAALGRAALRPLAMFDVGAAFCSFGLSFAVASHYSRDDARMDLRAAARELMGSVPFLVYVVTLAVALAGVRFPAPVREVASLVAPANMPLALLLLGLHLRFNGAAGQWRPVAGVLLTRLLVGLAVGLPLFFFLPFDRTLRAVLLVGLLLPPPMMPLSHADRFGYDARFVGLVVNAGNVASYFLIWALFNVLQ